MFGAFFLFRELIFLKIVTVSFTALIYLEILNVYMEIKKFHKFMIISLIATFTVYTLCLWLLPSVLDIVYIFQLDTFWRILLISFVAWIPFYVASRLKQCLFPQEYEKLK